VRGGGRDYLGVALIFLVPFLHSHFSAATLILQTRVRREVSPSANTSL
jgi:hypothetical protein